MLNKYVSNWAAQVGWKKSSRLPTALLHLDFPPDAWSLQCLQGAAL